MRLKYHTEMILILLTNMIMISFDSKNNLNGNIFPKIE